MDLTVKYMKSNFRDDFELNTPLNAPTNVTYKLTLTFTAFEIFKIIKIQFIFHFTEFETNVTFVLICD